MLAVVAPLAALSLAPTMARADDGNDAAPPSAEAPLPPAGDTLLNGTISGAPEVDVEDARRPPVGYTEVRRKRTGRVHDVVVSPMVGASGTTGLSLSGKW